MKRHTFALTALLFALLTTSAFADVFEGHLLPSKCRDANPVEHTKSCALACRNSGFGLMTNGEFVPFDPAGSKKALALLQSTDKAADLRVRVEGTRQGALIAVESIALAGTAAATTPQPKRTTAGRKTVAILLFDGVQTIDYAGPYEVLSDAVAAGSSAFRVVTVAEKPGTIRALGGLTITPDFTFADAPHADVVVLPGGGVLPQLDRPQVMTWVRQATDDASLVLTVCNGNFFLGKAGLLDGVEVTTTAGNLAALRELAPRALVTAHKRVTDNGKIITSGGLAAGIDGALHVVERVAGAPMAHGLALFLEYNWQPEGSFLPATLAFRHLTPMLLSTVLPMQAELVSSEGDAKHWVIDAKVETLRTPAQIAAMLRDTATSAPGWSEVERGRTESSSCFAFRDYDDARWTSCYEVTPAATGGVTITLRAEAAAPAMARK